MLDVVSPVSEGNSTWKCWQTVRLFVSGSTDCICFATVGTNDPVTSALHIIVGQSHLTHYTATITWVISAPDRLFNRL